MAVIDTIDEQAASKEKFLQKLQEVQDALTSSDIEYRIIGSVAVHAVLPPETRTPLSFERRGGVLPYQNHPDIDVIVPRAALGEARAIREDILKGDFPVKLGLAASVSEIDFRPDEDESFLTHKDISIPVSNHLLAPYVGDVDGTPVKTFSIPTLTQTFGTFGGIVRKKDIPKIRGLLATERGSKDMGQFREFRLERRKASPTEAKLRRGYEVFESKAPPLLKNAVAATAIKAADILKKR